VLEVVVKKGLGNDMGSNQPVELGTDVPIR